mmetsp:Transcript_13950/g.44750  ORF Transcript_13950/g.44750 Transcript_13950/m.44750 type:complete len:238 (+) Transcript_13950:62-775(+)
MSGWWCLETFRGLDRLTSCEASMRTSLSCARPRTWDFVRRSRRKTIVVHRCTWIYCHLACQTTGSGRNIRGIGPWSLCPLPRPPSGWSICVGGVWYTTILDHSVATTAGAFTCLHRVLRPRFSRMRVRRAATCARWRRWPLDAPTVLPSILACLLGRKSTDPSSQLQCARCQTDSWVRIPTPSVFLAAVLRWPRQFPAHCHGSMNHQKMAPFPDLLLRCVPFVCCASQRRTAPTSSC